MGPHSFKCGSRARQTTSEQRKDQLQWGRTLSSAEVKKQRGDYLPDEELQWGRTLSSAEV